MCSYIQCQVILKKAVDLYNLDFVVAERGGVGMTHISSLEIQKEDLMWSQLLKGKQL